MFIKLKRPLILIALLSLFIFPANSFAGEKTQPDALTKQIDFAISRVKPALVRIFVVAERFANGQSLKYEEAGSGTIISPDGYVITNHHVAGNAKQILCTLSDREQIQADLVSTDPLTDIAIIKLRSDGKRHFPTASFGDSSSLKTGERVLAMGSPYALSQSVTMGIVSNTELVMPPFIGKFMLDGEDVGSIVRWIGHDAPIFPGNSGGPLVNLEGQIIGINEIDLGLGGAIPSNLARAVAEDLIKKGRVNRSWFGLEVQPLLKDSGLDKGALVSGIINGSPAEAAGFRPGDILLKIGGKDVNVRFREEVPTFNQMLMSFPVGSKVEALVSREGKRLKLSMTSDERQYAIAKEAVVPQWGIAASNLTFMSAKEADRDSQDGVLVSSVKPGGAAWEASPRILSGDVILKLNGQKIKNLADFLSLTEKLMKAGKGKPVRALVSFDRKGDRYIAALKLGADDGPKDQGFEARKAWLPVDYQVVTKEIAGAMGMPDVKGVRITRIYSGKAGLKAGDIITALDGEAVNVSTPDDKEVFQEMMRGHAVGSSGQAEVLRDGKRLKIPVVYEESPLLPEDMKKYTDPKFELCVRNVAFKDSVDEGWSEGQKGVLVESEEEGGLAALATLQVGDLILSVGDKPVTDVASFESAMDLLKDKKSGTVPLHIRRGIHEMFLELDSDWPKADY